MITCKNVAPSSLEAALRVSGETSQPPVILAGGTQLLVQLRDQTIEDCLAVLETELQEPLDDTIAPAEYRVMMGKALVRKALRHLHFPEHGKQQKTRKE